MQREEFVGESFGRINKEEAALSISQLTNYINKEVKTVFWKNGLMWD